MAEGGGSAKSMGKARRKSLGVTWVDPRQFAHWRIFGRSCPVGSHMPRMGYGPGKAKGKGCAENVSAAVTAGLRLLYVLIFCPSQPLNPGSPRLKWLSTAFSMLIPFSPNPWFPVFPIDSNSGGASSMTEMIVQSNPSG